MNSEIKKNKISIYLLKNNNIEDVLREDNYQKKQLSDNKFFYYTDSFQYEPKWKKNFFSEQLEGINIFNRSSRGIYFCEIPVESNKFTFAIPFGYGHSMIDKTKCVDNFGLKLVLNLIDRESVRKISKRTLASDPKNTIEQLSKVGNISDFSMDTEQDLLEEVTGKPKKGNSNIFGENLVTGKTAFTISKEVDISNVEEFLKNCIKFYKKDDYKENFSFIDFIKEIKDNDSLNEKLVANIKKDTVSSDTKLWLAIPEIIEWEDVAGFSFNGKNKNLLNDIYYENFKNSLSQEQKDKLDLKFLKNKKITVFKCSDDTELHRWSVFQCIYCEITEDDKKFILVNRKWYEIAQSFVDEIEDNYQSIMVSSSRISLLKAENEEKEDKYNERLSESIEHSILMDKKIIRYGGGSSAIEFCDVYDKDNKRFIHVKNYYGSSALSHLFAQGRVSGQLFLNDESFRNKVIQKESSLKFINDPDFDLKSHKIIFGVISKSKNSLNLPFFSKVNLKSNKKLLEAFGFNGIYLVKIQRQ